ncbi:MAG TPA: hypothetical protein VGM77_07105 [Gemmatimonadales bacterium]
MPVAPTWNTGGVSRSPSMYDESSNWRHSMDETGSPLLAAFFEATIESEANVTLGTQTFTRTLENADSDPEAGRRPVDPFLAGKSERENPVITLGTQTMTEVRAENGDADPARGQEAALWESWIL